MKRILSTVVVLFSLLGIGNAQYLEVGVFGGASNYAGDLQFKTLEDKEINAAYGAFARYNISKHFAVRLQALATKISGSDLNARASNPLRSRNLSFETSIIELALMGEVNVFGFDVRDKRGSSFFIFGGVGGARFNPKAELLGISYDLQPLGTEGQTLGGSSPYKLFTLSIPAGIGAKLSISNKLNVSLEYGVRITMTDYLDDVSTTYPDLDALRALDPVAAALSYRTMEIDSGANPNPFGEARGNAGNKDRYMIGALTISYNLATKKSMEYDEKYKW
ncbi:MAG: hypothetical protein KJP00_13605 [Bacteroidia bacterium]|nr:hypothetical protein [Bacteroidia bacterium]